MVFRIFDITRIITYIAVFALLIFLPLSIIESGSICVYSNLFGVRCPGCGITRATANLLRGNFIRAWEYNKLGVMLFPVLFGIMINDIYCIIRRCLAKDTNPYLKNSFIDLAMGRKDNAVWRKTRSKDSR